MGIDARIGVVMAWEERGSCLNIFRRRNPDLISETFTNYDGKDLLRKNLHELRGKSLVAQVSETRRLALYLRTRVELMLELVSSWRWRSVDHILTYSGEEIADGCKKPSRITRQKTCCASTGRAWIMSYHILDDKSWSDLRNLHELRGKTLVAQVTETRRFVLYLRTRVDLMLELESSWHGRSVDHVLTYFGREFAVGSQKPSRIMRQKDLLRKHGRSVDHVLTYSGQEFVSAIDARIGVVMAWEERGSCLNELEGKRLVAQVSETCRFALYFRSRVELMLEFESSRRGRSVDHGLTYSGEEIAVGFQKPSRISSQKTCCASEGNTSVHVVFANPSGFDARIGINMAWEECGPFLNIFRMRIRGRIS
ncbi:uncharacterized protein G2W53_026504 [Senna tora]|uniref:Uncharacterized protein n=1 Tax=Senna tora TaxID=362788 RepID=A0A834THA2_9FABA|nr:uncharacterized protein G2W53_026504 [Senna tora]